MSSIDVKKRLFDLYNGSMATTGAYGLADLVANTDELIEQIYVAPVYSDEDRAKLVARFAAWNIAVLGEFPRKPAQLPCVSILRASDGEQRGAPIGDYMGQVEDEITAFKGAELYGTRFDEVLEVHVWASGKGSRMQRDILYLAVRELFVRGRRFLMAGGAIAPTWRNGKDGQAKKPEFESHIVHAGYAQIGYRAELTYVERPDKIRGFEQNVTEHNGGQVEVSAYLSET